MITVSDRAKKMLWTNLASMQVVPKVFRLTFQDNGFRLKVDRATQDDRVIQYHNAPVLVIDGDTEEDLDDILVDVREDAEGERLTLRRLTG